MAVISKQPTIASQSMSSRLEENLLPPVDCSLTRYACIAMIHQPAIRARRKQRN
jgi:hypothetical protein